MGPGPMMGDPRISGGPPRGAMVGRGPLGPPGDDPMRDRLSRMEGFLRSMDANANGMLEINEVPEQRRRFFAFMAERAGLDPGKPIAISAAVEAMRRRFAGGAPGGSEESSHRDHGSGSESSDNGAPDKEAPSVSLVPGFGVPAGLPPVPGFGPPSQALATVAGSESGRREERSSKSHARSDDNGERAARARRFAEMILGRYDKNHNGRLERDEWRGMRGNPEEVDRNHDGVITREELTRRVMEYGRGRPRSSDRGGSSRSGREESGNDQKNRPVRFLRPTERLPDDLPDWFYDRDKDEDGQIAMAEFATAWSESKVREFRRYDLNSDGVITPEECLKAEDTVEQSGASQEKPAGASSAGSDRKRRRIDWGGLMFGGR